METHLLLPKRFLTEEEQSTLKQSVLAGFPRSGNTMTRNFLELITGIFTGSNMPPEIKLKDSLTEMGLKGDNINSRAMEIIDTHFPFLSVDPVLAHRAIVIIRNPFDILDSFWNLQMTCSQTGALAPSEYTRFQKEFDNFIKENIQCYKLFVKHWITLEPGVPLYFLRYEDIVNNKQDSLVQIMTYLNDGVEIRCTSIYDKILQVVRESHTRTVYKRRSKGFFSSLSRYTPQQFELIATELGPYLKLFGYEVDKELKSVTLKEITTSDFISLRNQRSLALLEGKSEIEPFNICDLSLLEEEEKKLAQEDQDKVKERLGHFHHIVDLITDQS